MQKEKTNHVDARHNREQRRRIAYQARQDIKRGIKTEESPIMARGVQDELKKDEKGKIIAPLKQVYIEFTRKSRAGVEYKYSKPIVIANK